MIDGGYPQSHPCSGCTFTKPSHGQISTCEWTNSQGIRGWIWSAFALVPVRVLEGGTKVAASSVHTHTHTGAHNSLQAVIGSRINAYEVAILCLSLSLFPRHQSQTVASFMARESYSLSAYLENYSWKDHPRSGQLSRHSLEPEETRSVSVCIFYRFPVIK